MTIREYLDRMIKTTRKSGPARRIGIKSIVGNPRLGIPKIGIDKIDRKRRYKLSSE